jgi:hypothetical protein
LRRGCRDGGNATRTGAHPLAGPDTRVLHAANPFVSAILRSPLHDLLGNQVLLLRYAELKAGRRAAMGHARPKPASALASWC